MELLPRCQNNSGYAYWTGSPEAKNASFRIASRCTSTLFEAACCAVSRTLIVAFIEPLLISDNKSMDLGAQVHLL